MIDLHSTVDMFAPVFGENWYDPEIADGATFRWTGPASVSRIRLPSLGGGELVVRWVLAVTPTEQVIEAIRVSINGEQAELSWAFKGAVAIFSSQVFVAPGDPLLTAEILAPTHAPPGDARMLGVAINRIEVSRLTAEAAKGTFEQIADLRERVEQCTREVEALRSSTSWKITAPLRWIKGARH